MYYKTKDRGITLISLIITLIIFVIVAVVLILSIVNNLAINIANMSKVLNLQKTVREQVDLGCSAINMVIAEAVIMDNSYSAKDYSGLIQNKLIEILNHDIMNLDGKFSDGGNTASNDQFEILIEYEGNDYKKAYKDEYAKIIYTLSVKQNNLKVIEETVFTSEDMPNIDEEQNLNDSKNNTLKQYINLSKKIQIVILCIALIMLIMIITIIIIVLEKNEKKKASITMVNIIKKAARKKLKKVCASIKLNKIQKDKLSDVDFSNKLQDMLLEKLNSPNRAGNGKSANKHQLNGEFIVDSSFENDVINIYYIGEDYSRACNDGNAKITYAIGIEDTRLNVIRENSTIIV